MKKYKITVRKCVYYYADVEMQSDGATDDDVFEDAFIAMDDMDAASLIEDDNELEILGVQDLGTGRYINLYEVSV
tara:strand:+ start:203 stop:427 length:225 start_codon:yes stop_codon:yes gene_type:complete